MTENLSLETNSARSVARSIDISDLLRKMISGKQIRMARAAVGWTVADLAREAGMSPSAIQRAEAADGVPRMKATNLFRVQRTLESQGVIFIDGDARAGEGVRMRRILILC
jgi:transcriptional regulator with XRE-family HTH domain